MNYLNSSDKMCLGIKGGKSFKSKLWIQNSKSSQVQINQVFKAFNQVKYKSIKYPKL